MQRPITTLFMLMSVDGKISMGCTDDELSKLGILQLEECTVLENPYLRLRYKVIK